MQNLTLKETLDQAWDVIIIGAGLGGGILGRRLTERGLSVLFVEKGPRGHATEQVLYEGDITDPQARMLRGHWPKPTESRLDGKANLFFGPYGCGVGGSSVFYAAALERPERHDLDDDPALPHPSGGWPVGFDVFQPYFDEASRILHLSGTQDPLSKEAAVPLSVPGPLPSGDAALMEDMQARGLHPYRLHLSVRYPDKCLACFGSKCPWGCKMDGRSAGVIPALDSGRAGLLESCEVREILDDGKAVTGVRISQGGEDFVLTAPAYALCAGSLGSPRLLLASRPEHPAGCSNSSGLVGRGLMFHLNEFFVLWPRRRFGKRQENTFGKNISLRDLYSAEGVRFGLVQSLGMDASYENMVGYLNQLFDQSPLRGYRRLRGLTRLPAMLLSQLFGNAAVFVGVIEDFPYDENRVVLNPDDPEILTFEYRYNPEILTRRKAFRRALKRAFRGQRRFMVSLQPMLNFGHPVGTLRFGAEPATSVLDPDCRSHDLANLFVADGSFMPSALGVNPSLTIAANALRVADIMANRWERTADASLQ